MNKTLRIFEEIGPDGDELRKYMKTTSSEIAQELENIIVKYAHENGLCETCLDPDGEFDTKKSRTEWDSPDEWTHICRNCKSECYSISN